MSEQLDLNFDQKPPEIIPLWSADQIYDQLSYGNLLKFKEDRIGESSNDGPTKLSVNFGVHFWASGKSVQTCFKAGEELFP